MTLVSLNAFRNETINLEKSVLTLLYKESSGDYAIAEKAEICSDG
jgi:hypothetical protein